jgi:hypothetical protein
MKNVTISLYSINELSKEAKNKAIAEHKEFLIDTYSDDLYDVSFDMTRSKYAKQLTKADVIESIEINDCLFYSDGEMAHTINFCGQHPRAGVSVLMLRDVEYIIRKD